MSVIQSPKSDHRRDRSVRMEATVMARIASASATRSAKRRRSIGPPDRSRADATLTAVASRKWVYLFRDGSAKMRDLLGGKGAGAAEMTRAGMPVPPGFTITTEACRAYYAHGGRLPEGLWAQVTKALAGTDAGTVALIDATGTTQSTLTFPASSALTTEGNANPTPFNVAAGSFYRLTWQKATAGGKCVVQVTTVRNGNG